MPFKAMSLDEDPLEPDEVPKGVRVYCPHCINPMYVRDPDNCKRHFVHIETKEHSRSIHTVSSELEEMFDVEFTVDSILVGERPEINGKQPDALAEFPDKDEELGKGIAIECVVTNPKDAEKTELYPDEGYTLVWVTTEDGNTVVDEVILPRESGS